MSYNLETIGLVISISIGMATLLGVVFPKIWKFYKKLSSKFMSILRGNVENTLLEFQKNTNSKFKSLETITAQILDELRTNGGTSIKDQITRIEGHLLQSSERQRAMVLDSEFAHFESDAEGKCLWVNRTYANMVGRSIKDLKGMGWINSIAEEDRDKVLNAWEHAVKEDHDFELKYRHVHVNGTTIPVFTRSYKMTDVNNKVIGYWGNIKREDNVRSK